jgi:hypothetical protein
MKRASIYDHRDTFPMVHGVARHRFFLSPSLFTNDAF